MNNNTIIPNNNLKNDHEFIQDYNLKKIKKIKK
jgi:hypothetical protein